MATLLQKLSPDDWALWRAVRLRALADAPNAFGAVLAEEERWTEHQWRAFLEAPSVVVWEEGIPVACGAIVEKAPGRAAIIAMWTDPAYRGRRHAGRVLDALTGWAGEHDLAVELGVNRLNEAARAAYTSYGFTATGRSRPLRDGSDQVCEIWELGRLSRG